MTEKKKIHVDQEWVDQQRDKVREKLGRFQDRKGNKKDPQQESLDKEKEKNI